VTTAATLKPVAQAATVLQPAPLCFNPTTRLVRFLTPFLLSDQAMRRAGQQKMNPGAFAPTYIEACAVWFSGLSEREKQIVALAASMMETKPRLRRSLTRCRLLRSSRWLRTPEVAAAYGWPAEIWDDDAIGRLFALNRERVRNE